MLYKNINVRDSLDAINLMGFICIATNCYRRIDEIDEDNQLTMYATLAPSGIELVAYKDALEIHSSMCATPIEFIDSVESLLQSHRIQYMIVESVTSITCANNSRDMARNLQRVKSSNVWSYAFNPKDNNVGDMLMQFKNKEGGAGDIYIYYDIPSKIWRQLVGAPSKGHAFWKLIRNVYTYAKLTGDKRTHLPNGI